MIDWHAVAEGMALPPIRPERDPLSRHVSLGLNNVVASPGHPDIEFQGTAPDDDRIWTVVRRVNGSRFVVCAGWAADWMMDVPR